MKPYLPVGQLLVEVERTIREDRRDTKEKKKKKLNLI